MAESTLSDELDALRTQIANAEPSAVWGAMAAANREIARRVESTALRPGQPAPDFELEVAGGGVFSLGQALSKGPVIVSFDRGSWCAFCRAEMRALHAAEARIAELSAQVVVLSPERPELLTDAQRSHEPRRLYDNCSAVARQFGLVFNVTEQLRPLYVAQGMDLELLNGDSSWDLPVPATYIVGRDGRVHYAFVEADYTRRADPVALLVALRSLE